MLPIDALHVGCELHGVLVGLQVLACQLDLGVQSILCPFRILHGHIQIPVGLVILLQLACVIASPKGNLAAAILLLRLLVDEWTVLGVNHGSPIFHRAQGVAVGGGPLPGVDQAQAGISDALQNTLQELWLDLALLVGHVVVLGALHGINQGVVGSVIHGSGVDGLHLLSGLGGQLIGCHGVVLCVVVVDGQAHKVVVGSGLFLVVGESVEVLLDQSLGLGISLGLLDGLQGVAVAGER